MDALVKIENVCIDAKIEESFTQDELLVLSNLVRIRKLENYYLHLGSEIASLVHIQNPDLEKIPEQLRGFYDTRVLECRLGDLKLFDTFINSTRGLDEIYAKRLGIDKKRFYELTDFSYNYNINGEKNGFR